MFTFGIKFNGFFIGPFDVVFVMKSLLPFMLGFLESLSCKGGYVTIKYLLFRF